MKKYNDALYDELFQLARLLLDRGTQTEVIEKQLNQKTEDIVLIAVVIKEAKNAYYAKRRHEGLVKIAIGALTIFVGFVITFFNYHANKSVEFAMFSFTSTGVVFVGWGLYKLIG